MSLQSPMTHGLKVPSGKGSPGLYDHNEASEISKPRSGGKGNQPEKFFEEIPGNVGKLESPFGTGVPMKGK